ncbi:hypothetical protein DRI50_08645 [candidate division KSB1 bacterium]|nr:MAG: hypothetical protein DRI50_08645 [candidate division KSB1 bacterium]
MKYSKSLLTLSTIAAFVVVAFAVSPAFSQDCCYWDNWNANTDAAWWNNNVPVQYALTAEQITTINATRTKFNQKILPLQNELRAVRIEYNGYASRYDADISKIKSYRKQVRNLEDKIDDLRLNARAEINKVLTKEQRLYFNNGNYGWWDADQNWWHRGRGMKRSGRMGRMMDMAGDRCW